MRQRRPDGSTPWQNSLRDGGYREAAAREEDLWRVLEDPAAPEDARAAAAMLLRKGDANAGPRLRVAAEAVASPKLRVALESAADPTTEDAAIDATLDAFDARAGVGS